KSKFDNEFRNSVHRDFGDRMGTLLGTLQKRHVKPAFHHRTDLCSRRLLRKNWKRTFMPGSPAVGVERVTGSLRLQTSLAIHARQIASRILALRQIAEVDLDHGDDRALYPAGRLG